MSDIQTARDFVAGAEALLVTAGAGMGVDSGLPDFRGNEGFWNAYPPYRRLGKPFIEMACPDRFLDDPAFGWGFYAHRMNLYRETSPHAGFPILKRISQNMPGGAFVFTSNVDGHFQKAGIGDDRVLECHGSIHHLQCIADCQRRVWSAKGTHLEVDPGTMLAIEPLPICRDCGNIARPNILMFNDLGWNAERVSVQEGRYLEWLKSVRDKRLLILEFGAGIAVPTVRYQSERVLEFAAGARLVRVNPREPEVPDGTRSVGLAMGALAAIQELLG